MDAIDRLVPYCRKFNALPFVVRRVAILGLCLVFFVVGVEVRPYSEDFGELVLLAVAVGIVWTSELWRLWKPLAILLAIYLRIFY